MRLLITGAYSCAKEQLNELAKLGHSIVFMQQEKDALPCEYEEVEGVICNGLFLYHDVKKFTSLKFIQLTSAGFDRVPMDYVQQKGIKIYNARGVYSIPMAEFAVSGVLQLYKQSKFFFNNQKNAVWAKHRGLLELFGKTVCIVGCGSVGNECAKRFNAFGCQVIGVATSERKDEVYKEIHSIENIEKAVARADVVVIAIPLTSQTKGLFNKRLFENMKDGSVLVNIARGAVVDQKALLCAVEDKLLGAVLDVFESEPLDSASPLWQKDNVILTPHNSFVGEGNQERLFKLILHNIVKDLGYGF